MWNFVTPMFALAGGESTEAAATTITTLLGSVGEVFTKVISFAGTVGSTIVGTPVLLLYCVAVPLVGIGVGMFARLLHSRG